MWHHLKNGFKLLRGADLLIIALGMYCFQYFMLVPILDSMRLFPSLEGFDFSLLVLAVLCVAAAGYVLNDYFEFENDKLFSPERNVIGTWISLDNAFVLQLVLNGVGIILGYYLAWKVGNYEIGNLLVVSVAVLWTYAMFLKRFFLIGNIVEALLWALVFVVVVIYEQKVFSPFSGTGSGYGTYSLFLQMKGYALFVFWVALVRSIISDMKNRQAAIYSDAKTLAVVFPAVAVKLVLTFLLLLLVVCIGALQYFYYINEASRHFWYSGLLIQPNLLIVLFLTWSSEKASDWHNQLTFLKLVLFYIVISLPVFYYFNMYGG